MTKDEEIKKKDRVINHLAEIIRMIINDEISPEDLKRAFKYAIDQQKRRN